MQRMTCSPFDSFAVGESVVAFLETDTNDSEAYGFCETVADSFEHVSLLSVSEADEDSLVSLDKHFTANVFDITAANRLCRSVIATLDVDSFAVGFAFDEFAGFDAFQRESLHCLPLVRQRRFVADWPQL